jgi:SAM-dependent methyltransferase
MSRRTVRTCHILIRCRNVNAVHNVICSSGWWARRVEKELLPWGLKGCELGDDVLEIGPGFGATTRVLARQLPKLTVLELDAGYCERLRRSLGERVDVVQGDATRLPFEDGRFSAAICFTMLHHIPSAQLQDRVFSEVARVLRPGGLFAGTDSLGTGSLFKLIHVGDILRPIDPDTLPARLESAGLRDARVSRGGRSFRFSAHAVV